MNTGEVFTDVFGNLFVKPSYIRDHHSDAITRPLPTAFLGPIIVKSLRFARSQIILCVQGLVNQIAKSSKGMTLLFSDLQ